MQHEHLHYHSFVIESIYLQQMELTSLIWAVLFRSIHPEKKMLVIGWSTGKSWSG